MENYEQLLGMGAPLSAMFRSPTPSALAKGQAQFTPPQLPDLMGDYDPEDEDYELGGLTSLRDFGRATMGSMYEPRTGGGSTSMLGGI